MTKAFCIALVLIGCAAASVDAQTVQPDPSQPGNYPLPDGTGKALVQQACTSCHDLRRVVNSNYQPEEWRNVIDMMVAAGTPLSSDQAAIVRDYLAASFPGKPKPKGQALNGPVQVTFQEWTVPTPGSRPHDPLAASDGSIWYSGQMADKLGRLDPATGAIKEFALPKGSGPHGLVEDRAGHIWYTANFAGAVGRLDPKTGATVQYPMPDAKARDPHTPLFAKDGILWFTLQNANMIGGLDPASGEIKLLAMPNPRSQPYGMVFDSKGALFFDEFGANRIGRLDPATLHISEYTLPDPNSRPRRIAIGSDDVIWYGDYAQGRLGRLDPASGKVAEFPSPGGPRSQPYGIVVVDGVVWYSESGVQPNTLVRFDPKTQGFQSWVIPSGGGVVRNMMPTGDGAIAMAESGVNAIALVRLK